MPKKQKKSLHTRPSTGPHPSLSLSRVDAFSPPQDAGKEDNRTVAESLKILRNEEARKLPPRPPPTATVHPSLRNLLDVPDTIQPRARHGTRIAIAAQTRRVPGPAAPPSWQFPRNRSTHESARRFNSLVANDIYSVPRNQQNCLPGAKWLSSQSLLHIVLKAMAEKWDWHLQFDQTDLALLPPHLKEAILGYVARYASDSSLARSHGTLRMLFLDHEELDAEKEARQAYLRDDVELIRLDLGRALGTWLPGTSSVKKEILRPRRLQSPPDLEARPQGGDYQLSKIPDSWEDVDTGFNPTIEGARQSLERIRELPMLKFPNLLHLSLSLSTSTEHALSVASWSSLLSITPQLSTLQSLSLRYWPCPTLTPHAAAISATISNPVTRTLPSISYGGTDMYTEPDCDWREASGILRKMSRHLYCLRWLDLTGCGSWTEALCWTATEILDDYGRMGPGSRLPEPGPEWNGSWRNVEFIGLGVGWRPPSLSEPKSPVSSMVRVDEAKLSAPSRDLPQPRPPSSMKVGVSDPSSITQGPIKQDWDVEEERRKYLAKKELETFQILQARAGEVARQLRALRDSAKGKWIEIDVSG